MGESTFSALSVRFLGHGQSSSLPINGHSRPVYASVNSSAAIGDARVRSGSGPTNSLPLAERTGIQPRIQLPLLRFVERKGKSIGWKSLAGIVFASVHPACAARVSHGFKGLLHGNSFCCLLPRRFGESRSSINASRPFDSFILLYSRRILCRAARELPYIFVSIPVSQHFLLSPDASRNVRWEKNVSVFVICIHIEEWGLL